MKRLGVLLLFCTALLPAHPMGNFSVNHYARLEATQRGVDLVYVLDLAELPTFDLLRSWQLERSSPRPQLESKAREQARLWFDQLRITVGGKPVRPKVLRADLAILDGAGNLPVLRITSTGHIDAAGGTLEYEDSNFPDRAGWKEIVIIARDGAKLQQASQTSKDITQSLTEYPSDPTVAPPQDLRARLTWSSEMAAAPATPAHREPVITAIPQPKRAIAEPAPASPSPKAAPPGAVVRGDSLSRLLHQREITPWMMLVGLVTAFILGAAHALTPGHGKTIVAAYLVGSRGTLKHAAFLGAMVTFTHTISVFALGAAVLFLFDYVMPEKIIGVLGVISGLSIVAVGLWMLRKRLKATAHVHQHHSHDHHHHSHDHSHHDHASPTGHTHMPKTLSWGGLVALGTSGGLVPCESALVLLLGATALGRVGLGLMLLLSFSAGLAVVLMGIGAIVLYAKNLLPERKPGKRNPLFKWVPVASAAFVTVLGLIMTGISLGWIRPTWMV